MILRKTKVIMFNSFVKREDVQFQGQGIESVEEMKYLGKIIQPNEMVRHN